MKITLYTKLEYDTETRNLRHVVTAGSSTSVTLDPVTNVGMKKGRYQYLTYEYEVDVDVSLFDPVIHTGMTLKLTAEDEKMLVANILQLKKDLGKISAPTPE